MPADLSHAKALPNKLRNFADADDLFDAADSDTILEWVNKLAEMLDDRRAYHRKYQAKKQLTYKIARKLLDPDEFQRVEELARAAAESGNTEVR